MEDWIYALDDFLDCLAKDRQRAKNAKEAMLVDAEINDVRELRAFVLGYIKGQEGGHDA